MVYLCFVFPSGIPVRGAARFVDELQRNFWSVSSLAGVHRHALDVTIKGDLQLAKGLCLHLTCVLQLADPVSLFFLEAAHLDLNLNSLLVLIIDLVNEVDALLSFLQSILLSAQLFLLLFLTLDHMLHRLSLKLVRLLLHIDHFKVLLALLFQTPCLVSVPALVVLQICVDVVSLTIAILRVLHGASVGLRLALLSKSFLFIHRLLVPHANIHDILSLLLGLFDFFPRLYS